MLEQKKLTIDITQGSFHHDSVVSSDNYDLMQSVLLKTEDSAQIHEFEISDHELTQSFVEEIDYTTTSTIKDVFDDEHIRMIVFEVSTDSGSKTDVLRWYTKNSEGIFDQVAVFPDASRSEESALWYDEQGMQLQNNLVEVDSEKRKYHPVVAIYNKNQTTKHNLFSAELFVYNNGTVDFENRWARISQPYSGEFG